MTNSSTNFVIGLAYCTYKSQRKQIVVVVIIIIVVIDVMLPRGSGGTGIGTAFRMPTPLGLINVNGPYSFCRLATPTSCFYCGVSVDGDCWESMVLRIAVVNR